ncbi:MAG: hypothetical protein SWY16_06685 [Cyanobacteriota bacterium]|nr:hypothetical protein [Cyanobacteriota bacterium]
MKIKLRAPRRKFGYLLLLLLTALVVSGCRDLTVDRYEATALTTYTWSVKYFREGQKNRWRIEEFGSNSLLNVNGEKPADGAVLEDDGGLWWPVLPTKPDIDAIEQRTKANETPGTAELLKTVDYQITYTLAGDSTTLGANSQVYRQAARSHPYGKALRLTLGPQGKAVTRAEPL